MKHAILILAALALLLCPVALQAGSITYNIINYSSLQNGNAALGDSGIAWTLSGSITTDGNINTYLSTSDITAWTFILSSSAGTYTYQSTDPNAFSQILGVYATATELTLGPSASFPNAEFRLLNGTGSGLTYLNYTTASVAQLYFASFGDQLAYYNLYWPDAGFDGSPLSLGGEPWVLANLTGGDGSGSGGSDYGGGNSSPEPASITLLCIGITGIAGYGWRRRKRAAA